MLLCCPDKKNFTPHLKTHEKHPTFDEFDQIKPSAQFINVIPKFSHLLMATELERIDVGR